MLLYTLRKYGIEPNYGFIMFEPDSTLADVRENFEFLKEMVDAQYSKYYCTSPAP